MILGQSHAIVCDLQFQRILDFIDRETDVASMGPSVTYDVRHSLLRYPVTSDLNGAG
jgi:hypothetical protein